MDEIGKYSAPCAESVAMILIRNNVNFISRRGIQTGKRRLFFMATDEVVKKIMAETNWSICDETDGWDFNAWHTLRGNY